jgi:ABC-2 type transport system ATP-binding protein
METTTESRGSGLVEMTGVDFGYGRRPLFSGLDLDLKPGNIYGLLGKNGAGKTSLLRLLAGLLFPGRGEVWVNGRYPGARSPEFLSEVYIIPEEFSLPRFVADRYIDLYAPFYPRFDYERTEEYLREFEIPRRTVLSSLSYGQKKKFLLAFGLACGSTLFLLDEPTNGLDIPSKSQFRRLVASAVDEERTFVISTHQVRDVEHLIDPVIIIEGGKIVFNRGFEEIHTALSLRRTERIPKDWTVIYSEADMKGFSVVVPAETEGAEERGSLDLETLFNAVVQNPQLLEDIFGGKK